MKAHVEEYLHFFGYGIEDFIPCEVCGAKAVDIHHIERRGMGASLQKNYIENLMALCRHCHVHYGDKKQFADYLKEIHEKVLSIFKHKKNEPF